MPVMKNTIKRASSIAAVLLPTSGCSSLGSLAEMLNARQVQSCLYYDGNAGPYLRVKGITATGGVNLQDCGVGR